MMTLGDYKTLAELMYGPNSKATQFFVNKIAAQGPNEPVMASEAQMLGLMQSLASLDQQRGEQNAL